jgi:hypothetical protein
VKKFVRLTRDIPVSDTHGMHKGRIFEVRRECTSMFNDPLWMVIGAGGDEVGVKKKGDRKGVEGELLKTYVLIDGAHNPLEFPAPFADLYHAIIYPCGDEPCPLAGDYPQEIVYHLIDDAPLPDGVEDLYTYVAELLNGKAVV